MNATIVPESGPDGAGEAIGSRCRIAIGTCRGNNRPYSL